MALFSNKKRGCLISFVILLALFVIVLMGLGLI